MYIKLYLTPQEKQKLEAYAAQKKRSVSKLCHDMIFPLPGDRTNDTQSFLQYTVTHKPETDQRKPRGDPYTHSVKVYFTKSEYDALLSDARGMPLSRYIRNAFLSRKEPVKIYVYTDDISALTVKVSGYIQNLYNFIAALALRRQLYEADYTRLIQIAEDTKTALKDAATHVKANRASIRSSGMRILRKEIQKAVEKQMKNNTTTERK